MASNDSDPEFINFYTPENASFYAVGFYKALDPESDDLRLLEILPGQGLDRIECNIIRPPDTHGFKYECISYRAGDPNEILEIEVDGHPFNAFASLGSALRKIRQPDRSRVVWADQICINQNDVEERGSQVSKMRSFYEQAECVIAWLGRLEGGDLAFRTVQSLRDKVAARMADNSKNGVLTKLDAILYAVAKSVEEELTSDSSEVLAKYEALGNMFRSELWGHLWIWQELIVAKSVYLRWEMHSIQLEDLWVIFAILQHLLVRERLLHRDLLMGDPPNAPATKIFVIFKICTRRGVWEEKKNIPLDRLLNSARRGNCADPSDKSFAFCGLGSPKIRITPDYKATTWQVYTSTAAEIMAQNRSLNILAYCEHTEAVESADLPTWCPDWSLKSGAEQLPLLAGDHPEACAFQTAQYRDAVFRVVPRHSEDGLHMSLFAVGLSIGTVRRIGSLTPDDLRPNEEKFVDLLSIWGKLVADEGMKGEEIHLELEKTAIIDYRGRPSVAKFIDPNQGTTLERNTIKSNYGYLQRDAVCGYRRFFVTSNGLMGMAPPHVEEGDVACALFGAQVPFLLRKDKDKNFYTLIGELYVSSGYMYGRATDEMEAGNFQAQEFEMR